MLQDLTITVIALSRTCGESDLKTRNIKHEYIEKETPDENGDIESFDNPIKTEYT